MNDLAIHEPKLLKLPSFVFACKSKTGNGEARLIGRLTQKDAEERRHEAIANGFHVSPVQAIECYVPEPVDASAELDDAAEPRRNPGC